MSRGSKVGGTKRRVLDVVGFTAIIVLFLLYMVPFILVLLNSFKQKRDIIKNPFSFITEKGYTLANYTKAFEKMEFIKAFGNSLFITGLSTLLVIIFASMVAYYFTRCKKYIFQSILCTDGSIHDHSIPGDHDPVSFHLRFRTSYVKPQTDTDLYAYRFCVEYVSIHLSGIYQERYPNLTRRGSLSGWMYQCTDIFQGRISAVETDHGNPCDLKRTGILERLSASVTGTWKEKLIYTSVIDLFFLRNLLIRLRCDHGSTGTYRCPDSGIIFVPAERDHRWRGSRRGEIIKEYYSCEVTAVKWW